MIENVLAVLRITRHPQEIFSRDFRALAPQRCRANPNLSHPPPGGRIIGCMKQRHDYHSGLLRPLPPPEDPSVKTLSLPELWGRVRGFLARVQDEAGSVGRLREQGFFGAEDRQEIEGWLKPVERLVRIVLIAQAVIRLLMTPDGRKLLRETPKAMPERRRPAPGEIAGAVAAPSSASPQPS